MLRRNECRLNFKNRPVRTGDLKGGVLNNPPLATNRGSQEPATNRVKRPHVITRERMAVRPFVRDGRNTHLSAQRDDRCGVRKLLMRRS